MAAVHFFSAFDEDIGVLSMEFINDTEMVEITNLWVDSIKMIFMVWKKNEAR